MICHIHQLARLHKSAATHGDLLISVAEYRTSFLEQAQRTRRRLLHFLNGLVVMWVLELSLCAYFVSIDLYNLWRVWFNVVIHNSIMLIATVGGLAIANDRISAIPEAAMLATPLSSDIILQIASARMVFGASSK